MSSLSRRAFLATPLAGLASGRLLGAEPAAADPKLVVEDPAFQPSTLFLTWQRDPTTTMTVQWIGAVGETVDTKVTYSALKSDRWQEEAPATKPYPQTDLKVFRAELTDLSPGTDYL